MCYKVDSFYKFDQQLSSISLSINFPRARAKLVRSLRKYGTGSTGYSATTCICCLLIRLVPDFGNSTVTIPILLGKYFVLNFTNVSRKRNMISTFEKRLGKDDKAKLKHLMIINAQ